MKKILQRTFLWLLLAISLFSFSGCAYILEGFGRLIYIAVGGNHRQFYLQQAGLTEEDLLPIEGIESTESYLFNGCVYNIIDLDDYHDNGYTGRYYQWRGAGAYLDNGYGEEGASKIVGLKKGKISYYVGGMTPFVYVSTYDENWDMISYHLRDYVKEGVEIPIISEAKFTGVAVEYSYRETITVAFEQSIMLKDIINFDKIYSGEEFQSTEFSFALDVEGFPYLQSGDFTLYERNGELYIYQYEANYWRVQEEYQFLLKNMAKQAQEGTYNEKSE